MLMGLVRMGCHIMDVATFDGVLLVKLRQVQVEFDVEWRQTLDVFVSLSLLEFTATPQAYQDQEGNQAAGPHGRQTVFAQFVEPVCCGFFSTDACVGAGWNLHGQRARGGLGGGCACGGCRCNFSEFRNVAAKFGGAISHFLRFTLLGNGVDRAVFGAGLGQSQLILVRLGIFVLNFGFEFACAVASRFGCRASWCACCQFGAIGFKVFGLNLNFASRLFARNCFGFLCCGQGEQSARLHAIDVGLDKRVWVAAQQGKQHLVKRHAGRQLAQGQFACGITTLYGDGAV